jgi:hypothetical protein
MIADASEDWKARHVKMSFADQRRVFAKEGSRKHVTIVEYQRLPFILRHEVAISSTMSPFVP